MYLNINFLSIFFIISLFCLSFAIDAKTEDKDLTDELNYLKAEALSIHETACDKNIAKSCSIVGNMYFKGDGVKQSFVKAFIPLEKACVQGEIRSCTLLAILYERGDGIEQDIGKANTVYEKSCKAGDSLACHHLAQLFEKEQNFVKAGDFYQQACDYGDNVACDSVLRTQRYSNKQ